MIFVGASQLYLGVHYPTNVLSGWTMSMVWVVTVAVLIGTIQIGKR
jgi:undecaprenyl-diphosphatase